MKPVLTKKTVAVSHRSLYMLLMAMMLYAVAYWSVDLFHIYQKKQTLASEATLLREDIWQSARAFGQQIEQYDQMAAQQAHTRARAAESQRSAPAAKTVDDDRPARPRVEDTNLPSKIQLLGVLEVELSETTSWHTVIKLIVSVLVTVLGIKAINYLFRRLESGLAH